MITRLLTSAKERLYPSTPRPAWEELRKNGRIRVGHGTYGSPLVRYFASPAEPEVLIDVGHYTSLAEGATILINADHHTNWLSTYPFAEKLGLATGHSTDHPRVSGPLRIGNDVWIGTGTILKGGLTIGNGSVIGAGAVVTRDVERYSIVGGIPARVIGRRFDDATVEVLEATHWWTIPPVAMSASLADVLSQPPSQATLDRLVDECGSSRQSSRLRQTDE